MQDTDWVFTRASICKGYSFIPILITFIPLLVAAFLIIYNKAWQGVYNK